MSFWSKIEGFLAGLSSGPEHVINAITAALVAAGEYDSPEQQLAMLKPIAKRYESDYRAELLVGVLRDNKRSPTAKDWADSHIVAMADTVVSLLGELPVPMLIDLRTTLSPEDHQRLLETHREVSSDLKEAAQRIRYECVDSENLRDALHLSYSVKHGWGETQDPRLAKCCVTQLELRALDEWTRARSTNNTQGAPD